MTMENAIVIGGGPAGLIAAAHLAGAGVTTTLLEAKAGFGGRAATDVKDGFALNQGPHALYAGSCGMRELKALGVDPDRWNPTSATRTRAIRAGAAFRPVRGFGALTWLAFADAPASMSAREWIAANVGERHRDLAAAAVRVTSYVADHDALPADVARAQLRLGAVPGVRYLVGGWQPMVDALAAEATRRGAQLHARAAVRSLDRRGDGWTVATDGRDFEADAVVLAAGLPAAFAALADVPPPPGPAAEVSVLDLGLDALPAPATFALGLDAPTYYSKHSPPKHSRGVLMSAMSYERASEAELERIPDAVHPGWRDHVTMRRHLPRMTAVGAVASPSVRPPVTVPEQPGLFLAGDWIGPEGWLADAAMASGAAAARAAVTTASHVVAA